MPKLSATLIRKAGAGPRVELFDGLIPGFGVRIGARGRSWFLMYRSAYRQRRYKITKAELSAAWETVKRRSTAKRPEPLSLEIMAAREIARNLLARVQSGEDIAETRTRDNGGPGTWSALLDDYLRDYVGITNPQTAITPDTKLSPKRSKRTKYRTAREYQKLVNSHLRPRWKARKLQDVTRGDVKKLLRDKSDTPYMANRLLQVIYSAGAWAVREGDLTKNPAAGIERYPEDARKRKFERPEIKALWQAFEVEGYPYGTIGQLAMLTAARREEIASLKWQEVDLNAGVIRLIEERNKGGREKIIVLSKAAVELIKSVPAYQHNATPADAYVFEGRSGNAFNGFSKAKKRVEQTSEVTNWRLHDFRQLVSDNLRSLRVPPHVIERVLGHVNQSVLDKHYTDFHYETEQREALELWADRLRVIVADDKVVPIHG